MTDAKLSLIPQEYVAELWPLVEQDIKRVTERDDIITADDHKHCVLNGTRQLWILTEGEDYRAVGITEIINGTCFIWALGGRGMKEWWNTQDTLEAWARHHNCKRVEFFGRRGWERALRSRGYKGHFVVLQKELR